MPVIEENTGFIYCVEVNLDDVVGVPKNNAEVQEGRTGVKKSHEEKKVQTTIGRGNNDRDTKQRPQTNETEVHLTQATKTEGELLPVNATRPGPERKAAGN